MRAMLYSILSAAILAAGAIAQLVPPIFNNTPVIHGDKVGSLAIQNYYRGKVDVPALTWCHNLTVIAQVAADWAAGADIPNTPINFTTRATQESTYSLQVVYLPPGNAHRIGAFYQAALAFWADNIHYHGEVIPDGDYLKYSPYTQMMWNGTTCVGMAGAMNRENGTFVAAAYSPPGNIYGQKPFNDTASNGTCDGT